MARPTKLIRKDLIEVFHSHIRNGASLATAADAAGIGASTVYAWMARSEELQMRDYECLTAEQHRFLEFREATLSARASREVRAIQIIVNELDKNNWRAADWYLERAFPERWSGKLKESQDGTFLRGLSHTSDFFVEPLVISVQSNKN
jgi:hypothetical protein